MSDARTRRAWLVLVLVFLFMLINYADKAVIGLSSVPIMQELRLNHTQFGLLGSAFFLLFAPSGIVVGFLAARIRAKSILTVMAVIWAAALLPVMVISSYSALLISRVVLGAAEGPSFPIAMHATYKWFENRRRPLASSVVASGAAVGTGVLAPLITWIIMRHSWHRAFGVLGLAGLIWACLWLALSKEGSQGAAGAADVPAEPRVSYWQLLTSRTAVGVYLAGFAAYWLMSLNIVWLANYLIKALQIAPQRAAWVIALPSVMQIVLAPLMALLSQQLSRRGYSSRISRGLLGALCVSVSGVSAICLPLAGTGALEIVLVGVTFSMATVIFTLGSALIGEISPATQRGATLAVSNSIHTLAGLIAPFAMGLLVDVNSDAMAGFRSGYLYAGSLVAVLGLLAAALIDPAADLRRFRRLPLPAYRQRQQPHGA